MAVAVFHTPSIKGEVVAHDTPKGLVLIATITALPEGLHGFHIHKAGDMRGEGCNGLCEHYDVGNHVHGGPPTSKNERHTGDLGNIRGGKPIRKRYLLRDTTVKELWGRSIIIHEGEDDLGKGKEEDSSTTGHSGKRMGCAIFGRICPTKSVRYTRKRR